MISFFSFRNDRAPDHKPRRRLRDYGEIKRSSFPLRYAFVYRAISKGNPFFLPAQARKYPESSKATCGYNQHGCIGRLLRRAPLFPQHPHRLFHLDSIDFTQLQSHSGSFFHREAIRLCFFRLPFLYAVPRQHLRPAARNPHIHRTSFYESHSGHARRHTSFCRQSENFPNITDGNP